MIRDRQIPGRSVVFRPEGVYTYGEREETAVEKDHKMKKSVGFQPYIISVTVFDVAKNVFIIFLVFFGLTKYGIPYITEL